MHKKISQSKGSAVLIVLALLGMLTALAVMSVDRANTDVELSYNQMHEEQAFYTAEAGIVRGLIELNRDYDWRGPLVDEQLGIGNYAVILLDTAWNPALMDTVIIRAAARCTGSAANVEAWVAPDYFKPFKYAAFGADSLVMRNSSCTDSYNSDSGAYSTTQLNDYGNIGSNGYIRMANTATANGDAFTSLEGGISNDNTSKVVGDTTTHSPTTDVTLLPDAEYDWAKANSSAPSGFTGKCIYNPANYSLTLNNYDTLILTSGVYYFSSVSLGQQSAIKLQPGAEITVYMTGNMSLGQGSAVNPRGQPSDFLIYSKGTQLNINQGTEFRAAFWGPNANIKVEQNTTVYGSLAGKSVRVVNSACIHFDRSLLKHVRKEIERMKVVAWRQM